MPASSDILKMFADELEEHIQKWEACCLRLLSGESRDVDIRELFRYAHNLKAGAQIAELDEVSNVLHRLEDYLAALKDHRQEYVDEALDLFNDIAIYFKECLLSIQSGEMPTADVSYIEAQIRSLLFDSEPTEEKSETEKEMPLEEFIQMQLEIKNQPLSAAAVLPDKKTKVLQKTQDITTKVKLSQLDRLIQIIGELSIEHDAMGKSTDDPLMEQSWNRSRKLLKDLQNTALGLRMQSVDGLFLKLEKSALDLARKLRKKVVIEKVGIEVELDKQIIEKISEPLTHIIRNAIDHGIEPIDERITSEKPEAGTIHIAAYDAGGSVQLIIEDDGKGIDGELIFKKAVEKGLIKSDAQLTEYEKRQLVLLPEFSTSEVVTEFSGRGVGMDVVKDLMDSIGGDIEIESKVGAGTRFILKIPTTVSVLNALIVNVEGVNYAIPTQDLREIVNLSEHEVKTTSQNNPFFVLRDNVVTIRRISEFLHLNSLSQTPPTRLPSNSKRRLALVVKSGNNVIGFPVESILAQQRVHIRPLEEGLRNLNGIMGTAILAGGEASLILNLPMIVRKINLGA